MRRPHYLKSNARNETVWDAVWADTETDQVPIAPGTTKHLLRFGWAARRRRKPSQAWTAPEWHRFQTPAQFWDWVFSLLHGKTRMYVFAHNGAFDYPVLDSFRILPAEGWTLTRAVIDSPPIILGWRRAGQTILMLDTLNIWRMPLAELGVQVGLPKLRMPDAGASPARWDAYCRRDVKVIMRACLLWWQFLIDNDLGGFAPTAASQAMRTYRHRFMSHRIFVDDHPKALELARASYLGGRTECFQIGRVEGPLFQLDVNSEYPKVMRDELMPTKLVGYTERASVGDLAEWLVDRCLVADVTINTETPMYPLVIDGRLCFPVGRFRCCLATPELEQAVILGEVEHVHRVAVYERAVLFREYVDYFWSYRLDAKARGDRVADSMGKKLPNSFYGKWGQRGRVYEIVDATPDPNPRLWQEYDVDTGSVRKLRALCGVVQQYMDEGESRESMPAIASHVTSGGRLLLWRLLDRAGLENTYYTDTDSLLTSRAGLANLLPLIDDKTLGSLKLERELPYAVLYGPKDYDMGGVVKTKGVSKSPYWSDGPDVVQEQWSSLIGLLRAGDLSGPRTQVIAKHQSRIYRKGVVLGNGRVAPFRLP